MTLAVVLCSAQSKQPVGSDAWVLATLAAVDQLARDGYTLVASVGMNTWELALWRAVRQRARVHVLLVPRVEGTTTRDEIARGFGVARGKATWESIDGRGKAAWRLRDARAVKLADLVVPVCLREGGSLSRLLAREVPARRVSHAFAVPYERFNRGADWAKRRPRAASPIGAGKLVHLTRSRQGPWPGESPGHYYAALARSRTRDPRDAFATLGRIVRERRIRGSAFRSRGGTPRVCFTASAPESVLDLVRFRARFARYSFEPYGVVIDESAAVRCGARPVVYGTQPGADGTFTQGPGADDCWVAEREWRVVGDLDLQRFAEHEVEVIAATRAEARLLRRSCPFTVSCFGYADADTERAVRSSKGT